MINKIHIDNWYAFLERISPDIVHFVGKKITIIDAQQATTIWVEWGHLVHMVAHFQKGI